MSAIDGCQRLVHEQQELVQEKSPHRKEENEHLWRGLVGSGGVCMGSGALLHYIIQFLQQLLEVNIIICSLQSSQFNQQIFFEHLLHTTHCL